MAIPKIAGEIMKRRIVLSLASGLALAFISMASNAAMVLEMGLSDLVGNADKVFRGTVMTKEPGMVSAGGGEFSTVVYTIRVDDALKGDFGSGKDAAVIELTMLGNLKADTADGNMKKLFSVDVNPDLQVGSDYVLFTTARSAVGLSTTVGLDQGLFRIFNNPNGRDMTANGLGNQGIFDGPVSYEELKTAINAEIN
jgi:hypothetical protein